MRRRIDKWVGVCTALCIMCAVVTGVVGLTVIDVNAQNAKIEAQAARTAQLARSNKALLSRFEHESRERRDQACRGLELGHLQEVQALRRTLRFYKDPPPSFRDLLSNPLVVRDLRERERAAQDDQDRFGVFVPAYCDEPKFGLKEPDPKLPRRGSIKRLLQP